ncbi:MAG TPA: hypothetical protein VJB59_09500 [Bdellovibrionota bacterium]|nr:hypothetical protein [Bdellovibrionota bacterium]
MNTTSFHSPEPKTRFGFYVAATTAFLTAITFVIAVLTPPLSGPLCKGSCSA